MTKKEQKAPSRVRYEKDHPVLALRIPAEEKAWIEREAAEAGLSAGEFVRRRASLASTTAAQGAPDGGIDETLRKLEIKTTLAVSRRTLSGPNWAAYRDVVEYSSAVAQIEFLESRTMDLPLSGLEAALPRVLKRANDVTGLPTLHESIRGFEARLSDLNREVGRSERVKADLEAEIERLRASVRVYEERIASVRRGTGMTESEVLRSLRDYPSFRAAVDWFNGEQNRLAWECQQAQAFLSQIQRDIERTTEERRRVKELRDAEFATLANRLTMEDVYRLGDLVIHRETQKMLAVVYSQVFATTRFLPGGPPPSLVAAPASGPSGAAGVPAPAARTIEAAPAQSASQNAASVSGPTVRGGNPALVQATNAGTGALPSFDELIRSSLAIPVAVSSPPPGVVSAQNEAAGTSPGTGLTTRAKSRLTRPHRARAKVRRKSGQHRVGGFTEKEKRPDHSPEPRARRARTRTRHMRGKRSRSGPRRRR